MQKDSVPYGSDVSAGKFECADCGKTITVQSVTSLPPCSNFDEKTHTKKCWIILNGQGDSPNDPYPSR